MRAPSWVRRIGRPRRTGPGTVEVTITADATAFVDAMLEAADGVSVARYRMRVAHERLLGQAYVGARLDQLCRDFGLDPVQVWRLPREREERERRERARWSAELATWRLQQFAALAVATGQPDVARLIGGSGA